MVREGSLLPIFCLNLALFKMAEIPFIIDGAAQIVMCVSKTTTCADVIAKLPNLQVPLAVFLSAEGVERELPGKTKLLKVLRANASSNNVEFVIKQSTIKTQKSPGLGRKRLSRDSLKKVSDLAFYVRYQKKKVEVIRSKAEGTPHKTHIKRLTTHASTNSMDAFLAKADLDEMARFLSFCGQVTTERLTGHSAKRTQSTNQTETADHVTGVKLSPKRKFNTPKRTMSTCSSSTGTACSSDTGYQSAPSETSSTKSESKLSNKPRRTVLLKDDDNGPKHSTPVVASRHQRRSQDKLDCTLTDEYLERMDECEGKSIIMERFIADQTLAAGNDDHRPIPTHRLPDQQSLSVFRGKKENHRFLLEKNCESFTQTEACDLGQFLPSRMSDLTAQRTLRRESAFANLRKCTETNRFSLPAASFACSARISTDDEFSYSFNCTFPAIDEHQSLDFSYSFTVSEESDVTCNFFRNENTASDDSLWSFEKTKPSFCGDQLDLTCLEINEHERNIGCYDSLLSDI
ncbi:uncharacterized protein LOC127860412 isoform X2 [Dreissena polymorpha]|nr:uncharacterized protein LOC127860412 isoform X2 [Dreissena polymorpha]